MEDMGVDHVMMIHGREDTRAMDTKKILASYEGIKVSET
jgi:hypothetical protein